MAGNKVTTTKANEGLACTIASADDQSIVAAAANQTVDLPVACRAGVVQTCVAIHTLDCTVESHAVEALFDDLRGLRQAIPGIIGFQGKASANRSGSRQ